MEHAISASPRTHANAKSAAINAKAVRKHFGGRTILNDVSLDFRPGETVAILGPSGGGKSTFLRCLNGLCHFDEGEVRVGSRTLLARGRTAGHELEQVRRSFGMIFQDFQLFPHRTVLANVTEAPVRVLGEGRRSANERAHELLRRVGLQDHAEKYPHQLSGGQKQRVAIARALAMKPQGLLCDEITSALDPELKAEVLKTLEDLKREGLTLLMVTHEIGFARRAADRVVVLCDGKILEDGTPREVLDSPTSPRMREFLQCVLG
ncbi:MAG: amino acid ABC transporter ATP-binding protein [Gemmataceae bacterium]|nr:amino acid ABC transporter ATP-binding protein [Gemmataceae bacterium]